MFRVTRRTIGYFFSRDKTFAQVAAQLSTSEENTVAFDVKAESERMRESIGKCTNQAGMLSVLVDYRRGLFMHKLDGHMTEVRSILSKVGLLNTNKLRSNLSVSLYSVQNIDFSK